MPAEDALLFIDANRYLALYCTKTGRELLASLSEQATHIFVPQQIVEEVHRNKLKCAMDLLTGKSVELQLQSGLIPLPVAASLVAGETVELQLQSVNIPTHFLGANDEQSERILKQRKEIAKQVEKANKDIERLAVEMMERISRSEDEVSKSLAPLLAKAVGHTAEELRKALDRKQRGNPPGKKTDTLGDQLIWEQILSRFKGKKRLWIISGDGDYGTVYHKKRFLNPLLYQELCKVASAPEVFWFDNIFDGIKHFAEMTGVKADELPTPEKAEEIKKEEKALPPLDWMSGNSVEVSGGLPRGWQQRSQAGLHPAYFTSGYPSLHPAYYPVQMGLSPDLLETRQPMFSSGGIPPASVPPPEDVQERTSSI